MDCMWMAMQCNGSDDGGVVVVAGVLFLFLTLFITKPKCSASGSLANNTLFDMTLLHI